jgi:hypothetical protein
VVSWTIRGCRGAFGIGRSSKIGHHAPFSGGMAGGGRFSPASCAAKAPDALENA